MKKNYILLIAIVGIICSSCEQWFDVSPKSDVKEEDLFKNQSGYSDVLTGVYTLMTHSDLYGRELSYGFVDVLAQYYYPISNKEHSYYNARLFDYTLAQEENRLANLWSKGYKAISNINILLKNIDVNANVFQSSAHYKLVKGEALGIRAFVHFDLCRGFGELPSVGVKGIPYVKEFSNVAVASSTLADTYNQLLEDINNALVLLKEVDPMGPNYDDLKSLLEEDDLFAKRTTKINYYALCVLKARVALYFGDLATARDACTELLPQSGCELPAPIQLATSLSESDKLFEKEILFRLTMKEQKESVSPYFGDKAKENGVSGKTALAFPEAKKEELYTLLNPNDVDFRRNTWYIDLDANYYTSKKLTNVDYIPLIRISELYLIMAEVASTPTERLDYLNKIRAHRGLSALDNIEDLDVQRFAEYKKEFMSEGQMFFYFKRLAQTSIGVFRTEKLADINKAYIWPIPVAEQEYGK
ncbi:MAG: RagB/SusD family nutrient uptake outer membrane protein [Marinifilaceae bacterium]